MAELNTIRNERESSELAVDYILSLPKEFPAGYPRGMTWENWGDRLKKHMKDAGVTQDQVAERLNVSQGAVAHWLKGRREINLADFFRLAAAARADPSYLLFGASQEAVAISKLKKFIDENPALQTMLSKSAAGDGNDGGPQPGVVKGRRKDFQ